MKHLYLLPLVILVPACTALPSTSTVGAVANSLAGPRDQQPMAPTDLRKLQTREYQDSKSIVFAATMTTLMDLGYRIQSADLASGLIIANATSVDRIKLDLRGFVAARQMPVASVFVEETAGRSRLRVSFAISDTAAGLVGVGERAIRDEGLYREFFNHLENEIPPRRLAKPEPMPEDQSDLASLDEAKRTDSLAAHGEVEVKTTLNLPSDLDDE